MMEFDKIIEKFKNRRIRASKNGAESTANRYARHVYNWREWLSEARNKEVWNAKTVDLRVYIEELSDDELAESTISQRVSAISKFYQDLDKISERYEIPEPPENPYNGLDADDKKLLRGDTKKKGAMKDTDEFPYLKPDKIEELWQNVPSPRLRNELIVKMLYNTGVRRGELAKMEVDDIDFEDKSIYIPPRKSPEERWVSYNEEYIGFQLTNWLHEGRPSMTFANESDYLFPTNKREHISPKHINDIVKESAENAGIQDTLAEYSDGREIHKITAHTLRHSYAMQCIRSGIEIKTLQELLGHEEIDTTLIYLQQSKDDTLQEAKKFNPHGES